MITKQTRGILGASLAVAALFVGCRTTTPDTASSSVESAADTKPAGPIVADISGGSAQIIYDAIGPNIKERTTSKGTAKIYQGRLTVHCSHNGMPPGAMGFPGKVSYNCAANVPLPSGAMGFPAPAFLKFDGTAAAEFSGVFTAEDRYIASAHIYEQNFTSSNGKLSCEKTRISSQLPPGVVGMPSKNPFDYRCVVSGN